MSEVGEIIWTGGKRSRVIERDPVTREGKVIFYSLRVEPAPEGEDDAAQPVTLPAL